MAKILTDILLQDSNYQVLEKSNGDCYIKQRKTNRYFFKKCFFASKKYRFNEVIKLSWGYKDTVFILMIFLSFYFTWLLISKTKLSQPKNEIINSVWMFTFLFINIVLHEFGHAITLLSFGGRPGKIKMKWYYFFPLISIDTSDIYIMPRHRGIFICYAGIMVNIYICTLVILAWPEVEYILYPIYTLIIFSLIPFSGVKTDGYNLFIRLIMKVNDVKGKKSKISKFLEFLLNITLIVIVARYFYGFFQ